MIRTTTCKLGNKYWWLNNKLHREDGPAIEYANGDKSWWINGNLHREDGPARDYTSGHREWWRYGVLIAVYSIIED